jgi:hypothetical protein
MPTLPSHAPRFIHGRLYQIFSSVPREKRQPIKEYVIHEIILEWVGDHYPELTPENIIKRLEDEDLIRRTAKGEWIPQPRQEK